MPTAQSPPTFTADEAQRFAALVAGFDTGNPSEAEAAGKFRVLRRMLAARSLRIVDAFELPEIRQALDDQMQAVRNDGPELQAATEQAAALREELTARTRDVRVLVEELADCKALLLRRQREYDALRKKPPAAPGASGRLAPVMGDWWLVQVSLFGLGLVQIVRAFLRWI
jgi:hypothetical protein